MVVVPEYDHSLARTFGRAHSEYAAALNHAKRRSGHVWQNRFFSCPLDAAHLENAMRYVELNPLRARLVAVPWAWPWSSARAHCSQDVSDVLLDFRGRQASWDYAGWQASLLTGLADGEIDAVRRATQTGEPLGSPEFLKQLEREAGRRLRVWPRGRPRKRPGPPEQAEVQVCLFGDNGF